MTCPVCKAPSAGTKPCPGYCEGVEDGREETWRALLERDVAEVERALPDVAVAADIWWDHWTDNKRNFLEVVSCQRTDRDRGWMRGYGVALNVIMQRQYMAALRRKEDCERWIKRARAALGGGR